MTTEKPSTTSSTQAGPLAHLAGLVRETVPPLHPAGRPFVATAALLTLLMRLVLPGRLAPKAGVAGGVLTAWCAWFFREPRRVAPQRSDVAVAPADGTVAHVDEAIPPAELDMGTAAMTRVSVFLTIFDVHVQRFPVTGQVRKIAYQPGVFLSADLDKASTDNERNSMLLRDEQGNELAVVQIAGLLARRIVCSTETGEQTRMGETYGLIRFGSRVDLYVPSTSTVLVQPGQRTVGGETVVAELPTAPDGTVRS